ncbi:hypothetical protein PV08_07241 [Exophiala spinifera]|uniref:polynucleotide adenylyltransferase n=1 Tax=Exophiala spinifera TaxID=91928 RepID=A0A0D1ZNS4_9EURO|nr:uncharacterized protein PV08_07241 [Exophiala spinifera]KIW14457.1 hypothetical protein PV08_07241 [Exophiala spinifera]
MNTSNQGSGFDDHVWSQLQNMSHQSSQRGRGARSNWGGRGQGRHHRGASHSSHMNQSAFMSNQASSQLPPTTDDFPPLGSGSSSAASLRSDLPFSAPQPPQLHPQPFDSARHGTPREYQDRARGDFRGRGGRFGPHAPMPPMAPATMTQHHGHGRPYPRQTNLYHPHSDLFYGTAEQQRNMRHILMKQSDYLRVVARDAQEQHRLTPEEARLKENFRRDLELVARETLGAKYPELDADQIKLKCYGSLANGFALANCDMDLLLFLPSRQDNRKSMTSPQPDAEADAYEDSEDEERLFNVEVRRVLEKAFLDKAYGARLLTNTRVPILRICERPPPELLHNLREHRAAWEKSSFQSAPELNLTEINQVGKASQDQVLQEEDSEKNSKEAGAPDSVKTNEMQDSIPTEVDVLGEAIGGLTVEDESSQKPAKRTNPKLEFVGDCGIQCDVNFTNFVAEHNSRLLWTYAKLDPRVGEVGTFVKIWAKARDINTPYRGTLSSYGYILMVLHYLMNIASPPVLPNLQYLAKTEDSWYPDRKITLFEGFDVRFLRKPEEIQHLQETNSKPNKESTPQLLRGFFRYYATREGFFWTRDVISIRQPGGIVPKAQKGWTEAKWVEGRNTNVRLRYLLAIEDPFEIEHNVARTVGHHGLVSIRDEFRRAWNLLERVGFGEQIPVEAFLEPVTDRVDTLRKDQDFHRQKQLRQMKQDLEDKEKVLLEEKGRDDVASHTDGTLGTSIPGTTQSTPSEGQRRSSNTKLTSTLSYQAQLKRRQPWRRRMPTADSDSESDIDDSSSEHKEKSAISPGDQSEKESSQKSEDKKMPLKRLVHASIGDILLANGRDAWGNLVPWDIDTQDGRWLHWRDNKIKNGTYRGFSNPTMQELDEQCPFDPQRPSPYSVKPYDNHIEKFLSQDQRPPWPAITPADFPTTNDPRTPPSDLDVSYSIRRKGREYDPSVQTIPTPKDDHSVGGSIPWDRTTRGGRWLCTRDKRILDGTWRGPHRNNWYSCLDASFPYNPSMTWKELEERNHLLRSYCASQLWPSSTPARLALKAAAEEVNVAYSAPRKESLRMIPAQVLLNHHNRQIRGPASLDSALSPSEIPSKNWHVKPGSSHSAPQAKDAASTGAISCSQYDDTRASPKIPYNDNESPDQDALRARRLAYFAKQFATPEIDVDLEAKDRSHHDAREQTFAEVQLESMAPAASGQGSTYPHLGTSLVLAVNGHESANRERSEFEDAVGARHSCKNGNLKDNHKCSELRVPSTLLPNMDRNERQRDEDPDIIPIPRKLGFQFDPRQLQDLAVIAKGGNGCARQGEEFNIEDEYEWGGGGMMGRRTSTALPYLSSGTPYEPGKGDEEGLLNELPGEID